MIKHLDITNEGLRAKIKSKTILIGGNISLKIYGKLNCSSGKRMKRKNRIFFDSEEEALMNKFRPCGRCMKEEFLKWKNGVV